LAFEKKLWQVNKIIFVRCVLSAVAVTTAQRNQSLTTATQTVAGPQSGHNEPLKFDDPSSCQFTMFLALCSRMLFEALRYKTEGRGSDFRWCHWNFSLAQSFRPHYGPGVDSASNRNEYREHFLAGKGGRCLGLTTLSHLYADCLEI